MRIIKTENGAEVSVYSSPKEMPVARYNEFQKYLLIASGIGHTMADADGHYSRMAAFIAGEDAEAAMKEAENNRHCIASIITGQNYPSLAFACSVTKIWYQGEFTMPDDTTEEGLEKVLAVLQHTGITQQDIEDANEQLKKK